METETKFIYSWYKTKVSSKQWNDYFSKIPGYTFLEPDGKDVWIGFGAVNPPDSAIPIMNDDDLLKIDNHRRAIKFRPYVTKEE